ncbi:MAG: zinc-ribbon domain-containing protein [Eubacteriales bacterium]|nr:zinc-ribbon domain-containing protein [Eubacteriales bacterium]
MFCPKCGTQLPDSAKFCNVCGNQLGGAPTVQQQYAPVQPKPAAPFKLPTLAERFVLAFSFAMFILMFLGWFRISGSTFPAYSLFDGNLFDINALFGLAKIVNILNVFVFLGYVFFTYANINKTGYGVSSAYLKRLCGFIFYSAYLFCVLFTLIGSITEKNCTVSAIWYFALLGAGLGFVMVLLPGLVRKFIKE